MWDLLWLVWLDGYVGINTYVHALRDVNIGVNVGVN